jgi:Domain of unknown function (DUF4111)/Nucleotidyltransferase domain
VLEELLQPLRGDLQAALGDDLVATYVTGSAAAGDFDADVSDIDLVVVVAGAVSALDLPALDAAHRRFLSDNPAWKDRLDAVYVASSTLAAGGATDDQLAVTSHGSPFELTGPSSEWVQNWHQLRRSGVALVGRPAKEVVAPIRRSEFVGAVRRYLDYLAAQPLESEWLGGLGYAVLSTCRARYTIATGKEVSKPAAAGWLKDREPALAALIDEALAIRRASLKGPTASAGFREAAIRFVRDSALAFGEEQRNARADERMRAQRDR